MHYWQGLLAIARKDGARARAYLCKGKHLSDELGHAKYGGVLSELSLARLDNALRSEERARKIVDSLAKAGDLRSLAKATEEGASIISQMSQSER